MTAPARIAGIILAAGASARMGHDKALLAYPGSVPGWAEEGGAPSFLLACTLKLRAAGAETFAVLGHNAAEIAHWTERAAPAWAPRWVRNPNYERGQFSSLRAGAAAVLQDGPWAAAMIAPVDHPDFAAETARRLRLAWEISRPAVVKPRFRGRGGHPVLYAREVLVAMVAAPDAATAREVQVGFATRTLGLEVADEGIVTNVDEPADLARLAAKWRRVRR